MTGDRHPDQEHDKSSSDLSRHDFVAMSLAAGLAAATGSASAAELPVVETNVEVKTPDGTSDASGQDRRSTARSRRRWRVVPRRRSGDHQARQSTSTRVEDQNS